MTLKTILFTAAAVSTLAISAQAEMLKSDFSAKITNMYAIRADGTRDNTQDANCKSALGNMFLDKEITGQYEIDTTKEMGGGVLSFEGETLELAPYKMGDSYALATIGVGDKLSSMFVKAIHLMPSAEPNGSRAEVLVEQAGMQYNCIAATHGPQG